MKKVLSLIVFLLFLLLIWFSWNWYKDVVLCCPVDNIIVKERYGPIIFDCVTGEVITNDLWPEKKKEILSRNTERNTFPRIPQNPKTPCEK